MTFRPTRLAALLALLALLLPLAPQTHAARVIFRYLPGQPALSSPVVAAGIDAAPYLDPRERTARGPGGWGLQLPFTALFEGTGSTLRSAATETLSQPLGPRLTAEVWVAMTETAGRIPLLGNRISGSGNFELGLDEATPYFTVDAAGQTFRVDATTSVTPGATVWIAATAHFDVGAQQLILTLYVDGRVSATTSIATAIPSPYRIVRPFFVGTEATGTPEAFTVEGRFSGQLFAATVRDYVAEEAYLNSSVPHDGSAYFGLPDFHDYDLSTTHTPMDLRIRSNQSAYRHRFYVPYVNDEFVPQGTATRVDVVDGDTTALVYLSYYHLTRSGQTGQRRSIVAEMDAATGQVRRTFRLMGVLEFSHAGGIAYVDDALYVSSSSRLERYPLPPYDPEADRYLDLEADASGTITVYGRASFVSEHDDTLWVGDWRTASQNAPYLYGYPLAEDGRPVRGAQPVIYALPRNVQGVDFFVHRGQTYVFMSRNVSMARGEAAILRVPRQNLRRWSEPEADSTILVPYGIEDLSFFPDGTLWTNSESGTDYYQRGSDAWTVFYPFVYSLPARTVFGEEVVTTTTEPPSVPGRALRLDAAPNPFRDATTFTLDLPPGEQARLHVTDLLGRRVATLFEGAAAGGPQTIRWEAAAHAGGLYFVVLEAEGQRVVRPLTLVR